MHEEIASFLSFQLRRCTESGDQELAMTQLRQFLELERESKRASSDGSGESSNVRRLPVLRAVN